MTFPWLLPLDSIAMFVSIALTVSGFLIAAASFIVGLYLREYDELAEKKKLLSYIYLIISLLLSSGLVIFLGSIVVISSAQPLWIILILMLFLIAPLIPIIAILFILFRHCPGGS